MQAQSSACVAVLVALCALACGGGTGDVTEADPTQDAPARPALTLGKLQETEAPKVLPGSSSALPLPEPVITAKQCKDLTTGGEVAGPDCITGTITCGESLVGHTVGGTKRYDTRWYERNFCTPATSKRDGGDERVYRLDMPDGEWRAYVTLDSPCADLNLAGFPMQARSKTCPGPQDTVARCDMYPDNWSPFRERIELVSDEATSWLLVVEGVDDEEGAFGLTVQCRPGLR